MSPGGGNLTPYGRGRGDFKKLPRSHGEARGNHETTPFFVTLFEGKYKEFCFRPGSTERKIENA